MKKRRVLFSLLIFALVVMISVPAMAEEGDSPGSSFGDVEPSGDGENSDPPPDDPTPPPDDPTPPPEDPTPPPDDPTPPPEDPTPPPDDPTPPPDDSTPEPGGDETPTPEPVDEPSSSQPEGGNTGGYQDPDSGSSSSSSSASPTRTPGGGTGGTIRQPSFFPRTQATPKPSGAPDQEQEEPAGPRYITFARLNQRNNSMSVVLFYSGSACVGTGVLGLIVLAVFIIRGRRSDERDEIFQEIQQAETRRPVRPRPQIPDSGQEAYDGEDYSRYAEGYESGRRPSLHRPEPEELAMPVNGSLYTEEFQLSEEMPVQPAEGNEPQAPPAVSMYTEEFQPLPVPSVSRTAPEPPAAPNRVSLYTEEFPLPEEMAAAPRPPRVPQSQRPVRPRTPDQTALQGGTPAPPAKQLDNFDTQELLREILHGDGKQ